MTHLDLAEPVLDTDDVWEVLLAIELGPPLHFLSFEPDTVTLQHRVGTSKRPPGYVYRRGRRPYFIGELSHYEARWHLRGFCHAADPDRARPTHQGVEAKLGEPKGALLQRVRDKLAWFLAHELDHALAVSGERVFETDPPAARRLK